MNLKEKMLIQNNYKSNRIPEFELSCFYDCQRILYELKVGDISFFINSFDQKGNNKEGNFWSFLTKLYSECNIQKQIKLIDSISLGFIDSLFQSKELRENYEGVYNTLNFIKNAIYKKIKSNSNNRLEPEILLEDYNNTKKYLDRYNYISGACTYLDAIKSYVPNSRSSISNYSISKTKKKTNETLTKDQNVLSEAIAFGCLKQELEVCNYTPAKRLIYVPKDKINNF